MKRPDTSHASESPATPGSSAPASSAVGSGASGERRYIGSSDAAAVAGLSRWGSPLGVWMRLVGIAEDERPPSLRMWMGKRLEPILLELYEAKTGRRPEKVIHPDTGLPVEDDGPPILDAEHPFIGAHPDFVGLETKTTRSGWGWADDGSVVTIDDMGIPLDYFLQVQHQMRVMRWSEQDLAVLIGHDQFRRYIVPADPVVIEGLVLAEVELWGYVQRGEAPPDHDPEAVRRYLATRYPDATEPPRPATPEELVMVAEWRASKAALAAAERQEKAASNAVREAIGLHAGLIGEATYRQQTSRRLDADVIREQLQAIGREDIIAAATKLSTFRVLRDSAKPPKEAPENE